MVRIITTQAENTQPMCEFHTQSILGPTGLAPGQQPREGGWFGAQFGLDCTKPKGFLN